MKEAMKYFDCLHFCTRLLLNSLNEQSLLSFILPLFIALLDFLSPRPVELIISLQHLLIQPLIQRKTP